MLRGLLIIGAAAAICAAVGLLMLGLMTREVPTASLMLAVGAASLFLAAMAASFAYRAMRRSDAMANELHRLARSMDATIRDFSARGDRNSATIAELDAQVTRDIAALFERIAAKDSGRHLSRAGSAKRSRREAQPATPQAPADAGAVSEDTDEPPGATDGAVEISLQPIINAANGAAAGFELHLHQRQEEGPPLDIRRLRDGLADDEIAALERLAVVSAVEAVRHQHGEIGEEVPIHVAVSGSLMASSTEFATVLDTFRQHPGAAKAIVLSLPDAVLGSGEPRESLADARKFGIRLAAEGWDGSQNALGEMQQAGAAFIKLPAEGLLLRASAEAEHRPSPIDMVEMAGDAGITIIATEVASDEDAISLLGIGIALMAGDHFAGPRRQSAGLPERERRSRQH